MEEKIISNKQPGCCYQKNCDKSCQCGDLCHPNPSIKCECDPCQCKECKCYDSKQSSQENASKQQS